MKDDVDLLKKTFPVFLALLKTAFVFQDWPYNKKKKLDRKDNYLGKERILTRRKALNGEICSWKMW